MEGETKRLARGGSEAERPGPWLREAVWVRPERYVDEFFVETARRVNLIRELLGRHIEARRFANELRQALLAFDDSPRGA